MWRNSFETSAVAWPSCRFVMRRRLRFRKKHQRGSSLVIEHKTAHEFWSWTVDNVRQGDGTDNVTRHSRRRNNHSPRPSPFQRKRGRRHQPPHRCGTDRARHHRRDGR
jgi:hypothetical protein